MPDVLWYPEPRKGLEVQLAELRGLVKVVPPLINADRQRRWEEIGARPGEPDADMIDIYESEAGPEEGWGHAQYDRILYSASAVNAWEIFHAYLVRQLFEATLKLNLRKYPVLARLVEEERRTWDRRFDRVKDRYANFLGIKFSSLLDWDSMLHARELRNALVHNQGLYTAHYLDTKLARLPTSNDLFGRRVPESKEELIGRELIPLSAAFCEEVIQHLIDVAREIDDKVKRD